MKKRLMKKIVLATASVFLLLVLVLCVHIYMVTRPKAPDEHTIIMARIDIKQDINQADADKITSWLYQQKGVNHVLCNPQSKIAVFTFFPIKNSGDAIVARFKADLGYQADRYMPTAEEMKSGCPVASTSTPKALFEYMKKVF